MPRLVLVVRRRVRRFVMVNETARAECRCHSGEVAEYISADIVIKYALYEDALPNLGQPSMLGTNLNLIVLVISDHRCETTFLVELIMGVGVGTI